MRIGLIDVDRTSFPNLVLMKLSAHHKSRGDQVEWWNGLLKYDRVYKAKVFDDTYSEDIEWCINADEIIKGGTGYDLQNKLPEEIEHIKPDYDLYNINDTAYGFLTRGCPRGCPFCIVKDKEGGRSHQVADLGEFWNGETRIVLLDPNITASRECEKLFNDLISTGKEIEFNQGIDVRLITDKGVDQLNQMKLKMLHFAWDNYEFKTYEKLKTIRPQLRYDSRSLRVYVLTNFNTTFEQDLERIIKLRELDFDPYVMIYDKPHAPRKVRQLQGWVNNKRIWRTIENFEDYKPSHRGG